MSDNFRKFLVDFANAWETETLQDKSEIRKGKFSYEITPNRLVLYIYLWNDKCVASRMEAERCWIDNTTLSRILREILPEYLPYFQGQRNLTSTGMKVESE